MLIGVRAGAAATSAARLAPNAALLYFPVVVVLGGSWWDGLAVVAVFLLAAAGSSFVRSPTKRAVDRALWSGEPNPARKAGVVLLVLSSASAAWGEWVLRRQAARWLAAEGADQRVAGGRGRAQLRATVPGS